MKKRCSFIALAVLAALLNSCSSGKKTAANKPPKPPPGVTAPVTNKPAEPVTSQIPYLTPAEEAKTFDIRDDYGLELVLSDPIIQDPVAIAFDGDGRMYVAEMRTYMRDLDGHKQMEPKSRVSLHWSSKHNGVYDRHSVFVDNLVLPRMILPLEKGVLINETDTDDIYLYEDTKGTGVADKKTLWHHGGGRGGNLEHQPSGLMWDIDNWIYMAVNAYRLRIKGTNVLQEGTYANFGQWGITQDDYGKTIFCNAGYESGPVMFQVPIIYGAFHYNESTINEFHTVWPLVGLADYQGGLMRVRPGDKTLNHFTGTCGQEVYRGDRLPADLHGDLLFGEPVGRMIRRTKMEDKEGYTYLRNAYEKTEFIRSTDPNFRPVNTANAPDGTLYVVDMYRGVIQESAWVNQGSYLRGVVEKYHLERNLGRGRIWRLTHKGYKPGPQPHMLEETPAQLVKHITNPNGWWRDNAQKLLVLRGDKSVAPQLVAMARSNTNPVVRLQALWTLEGLDSLEPAFVREKLKDEDPHVRCAAIRVSETLYKAGDHSLVTNITALAKDPSPDVVIQLALTANLMKWPGYEDLIRAIVATNKAHGVQTMIASIVPAPPPPPNAAPPPARSVPPALQLTGAEKQLMTHGEEIYKQLCFACHGLDGKGTPLAGAKPGTTMAPPLSGSKTATGSPDAILSVVLKGLSGPVNGVTYDAQMVSMQNSDDDWIASVASYVRNSYGNHCTFISTNDVARVRAALKARVNPWTLAELTSSLPQPMTNRAQWKLTASHNGQTLHAAVDGNLQTRFSSGRPQTPGMWVQIELPEATKVSGIILDSGTAMNEFPQGYKVELSLDGKDWGKPVASGHGTCPLTQIVFPAAGAKFIRITQTGGHPNYSWDIAELNVLQPPGARKIEVAMAPPSSHEPAHNPIPATAPAASPFDVDPLDLPPAQTDPPVDPMPNKPAPPANPTPKPSPPPTTATTDNDAPPRPPPFPPLPPGFTPRAPSGSTAAVAPAPAKP